MSCRPATLRTSHDLCRYHIDGHICCHGDKIKTQDRSTSDSCFQLFRVGSWLYHHIQCALVCNKHLGT